MAEKKRRVLLADDEEDIKIIIQMYLESNGYEVVTAYDGLDAVEKAKETRPDLILMDIMMPIIDGIEVTRQIKAAEETKNIPVVMLTRRRPERHGRPRNESRGSRLYFQAF